MSAERANPDPAPDARARAPGGPVHRFQVNLRGILDLLAHHLYSGPQVFLRELLQNASDAILARRRREAEHAGRIEVELTVPDGGRPTLMVQDNGCGLTEEEIHRFLATIGESSKREDISLFDEGFIGRFGIGILSCFMVSDEVNLVTRSSLEGSPALLWRGRQDGTYTVQRIEGEYEKGTKVFLVCRKGFEAFFSLEKVLQMASTFGALLSVPITVSGGGRAFAVNVCRPSWLDPPTDEAAWRASALEYARREFGQDFLDAFPLHTPDGEMSGAAFVLPQSPSPSAKIKHRVYLRGMFLSDQETDLLPEWAFFVHCAVNLRNLRPTASREALYRDADFERMRAESGRVLREKLLSLAASDPPRLVRLVAVHYLSIKALAVHDEEFLRLFARWLLFETSMGMLSLGEFLRRDARIRYVRDQDEFQQLAPIFTARDLCVINAGHTYDREILEKAERILDGVSLEAIRAEDLASGFEAPSEEEFAEDSFLHSLARQKLLPYDCDVHIRRFQPDTMPALLILGSDNSFFRLLGPTGKMSDPLWASVIDQLAGKADKGSTLYLNAANPVIARLAAQQDDRLGTLAVQSLYLYTLLLSRRPLSPQEWGLLNRLMIEFIEWGLAQQGRSEPRPLPG
jgi:molecular chaperone HtpG